jgi:hypothetical protein
MQKTKYHLALISVRSRRHGESNDDINAVGLPKLHPTRMYLQLCRQLASPWALHGRDRRFGRTCQAISNLSATPSRASPSGAGFEIVAEFYDAAVSGADPIQDRPGFAALLDRIESNGIRTVVVEDASRFARELMAVESTRERRHRVLTVTFKRR